MSWVRKLGHRSDISTHKIVGSGAANQISKAIPCVICSLNTFQPVWTDKDNNACSQDKNHLRSGFHFTVTHFVKFPSAYWVTDCLFSDFRTWYHYKFLSALCNRHCWLTTQFQLLLSNKTRNVFSYPSVP